MHFSNSAKIIAVAAMLSGCASPQVMPQAQAQARRAVLASCRQQVEQLYLKQNRAILSQQDTMATPFSSSGQSGIASAGLGQAYGRDQMIQDCLARSAQPDSTVKSSTAQ